MTFCLAVATPHFALLAADTRAFRHALDDGAVDLTPTGCAGATSFETSKLHPLRGGWLTGSPELDWERDAARAIGDVDVAASWEAAEYALQTSAERQLACVRESSRALADAIVARTRHLLVRPTRRSFEIVVTRWDGDVESRGLGTYWLSPIDRAQYVDLFEGMQAGVETMAGVSDARTASRGAVSLAAAAFTECYQRCGPDGAISNRIELGLLWRDRDGTLHQEHAGPLACPSALNIPDSLLEEVSPCSTS
jgi:hypothetical protein